MYVNVSAHYCLFSESMVEFLNPKCNLLFVNCAFINCKVTVEAPFSGVVENRTFANINSEEEFTEKLVKAGAARLAYLGEYENFYDENCDTWSSL